MRKELRPVTVLNCGDEQLSDWIMWQKMLVFPWILWVALDRQSSSLKSHHRRADDGWLDGGWKRSPPAAALGHKNANERWKCESFACNLFRNKISAFLLSPFHSLSPCRPPNGMKIRIIVACTNICINAQTVNCKLVLIYPRCIVALLYMLIVAD